MTATTPQIDIGELRTLFLFESLGDADLQWIAERAEVRVFDSDVVVFALRAAGRRAATHSARRR
jgi:hypothetical protein